jgi:hypothetical protein
LHGGFNLLLIVLITAMPGPLWPRAMAQSAPSQMITATSPPLSDPLVHADAMLRASKARAWAQGGEKMLLLEGDVEFRVGAYGFRAQQAVVRIATETRPGLTLRHLSVYLDQARPLHAGGAVTAEAPRLLVTVATLGKVVLETDLLSPVTAAPPQEFVQAAASRFEQHQLAMAKATLAGPTEPLFGPQTDELRQARQAAVAEKLLVKRAGPEPAAATTAPAAPSEQEPSEELAEVPAEQAAPQEPAETVAEQPSGELAPAQAAAGPAPDQSILPVRGTVGFTADRLWGEPGQNALAMIGNVRVLYNDIAHNRAMALSAEKVVVFADMDVQSVLTEQQQLQAGQIRGVYLEDNVVVTDGQYTVRAPRMYFDLTQNKAIVLEAVMFTWDLKRKIPLYMRAEVLRQTSAKTFEAQEALLTTSEFAEPHFAIGADRLTIERVTEPDGNTYERFTAQDSTLRIGRVPVFYWPYLAGDDRDVPIREVQVGNSDQNGMMVQTTWDVFALAGKRKPEGVDVGLRADYMGDHGGAAGVILDYERSNMFGNLDSYLLPSDSGTDEIGGRRDIEQNSETRGFMQWQHRQYLREDWELSLETAYVSDETFLEEFFREEATQAKPYETSLYLKKQRDEWAISLLGRYDLNDFTPQTTTLQTPGYTVDKLPELGYFREGTSLWGDRLSYFTENRLSRMRLRVGEDTPFSRGFGNAAALELFGIPAMTSFQDAADAAGLPDDWRSRLDSRHEITAPMKAGPFDLTPYAVGRITGYDADFNEFSGEDDQLRLWGSVGTRVHTQIHRSYDQIESQWLDVHRLRHVIEPSVDVFTMASTIDPDDLPVFDADVEGINEGSGTRFGLRNTLQTQRGGPGRWRSVDWLVLDTDVVLRSDDADVDTEIARFFNYRPEYSVGGDHFYSRLLWMVTDTLAVTGELTENLENNELAQWRVGGFMQNTPRLSTFVDYQEIRILDSRLLSYGFSYELTTKYSTSFSQVLDFSERQSRTINFSLQRRLPRWLVRFVVSVDELENETTVGVVLLPEGLTTRASPVTMLQPSPQR